MGLNRPTRRYFKNGRHYPPELMPIVYCTAVLGVVLKENPEAKRLFEEVKVCCRLPGFQQLINELFDKLVVKANSGKLIKELVESAGYAPKKAPPEDNQMVMARAFLTGLAKVINKYSNKFNILLLFKKRRWDVRRVDMSIDSLIKVGFNNKSERSKGKYKVKASNDTLVCTIIGAALAEESAISTGLEKVTELSMYRYGNKRYSANAINEGALPDGAKRFLTSQALLAGFKIKNDQTLAKSAYRWYQCRVTHDGPTEYYFNQLKERSKEDPEIVTPENLLHEIKVFDDALGYEREKTGKHKG